MATQGENEGGQYGVRFSSVEEQIEPAANLQHIETLTNKERVSKDDLTPEAIQELKNLSITMQKSRLQSKRMADYSFEPVSLPASRAPSPSSGSRTPSLRQTNSPSSGSPVPSPHSGSIHSPPLTPSGTATGRTGPGSSSLKGLVEPALMTPEISPPHEAPPTSMDGTTQRDDRRPASGSNSRRASPKPDHRHKSESDVPGVVSPHPKHVPTFTVGAAGDSVPASRDASPGRSTPGESGADTPIQSRPYTPNGDKDNPYARSRRGPQPRHVDGLESRFVFAKEHAARRGHASSSSISTVNAARVSVNEARKKDEKRSSGFFGRKHDHTSEEDHKDHHDSTKEHSHSSMSELKRFFKIGGKHKDKKSSSKPSSRAPSRQQSPVRGSKSGTKTPPVSNTTTTSSQQVNVPFADDHGLQDKYGKFGKVLGSGAGGSVRLMKRSSDGVTFAVKQFRAKHSYESEKDYTKKVTGEFCIGSTLHHGNIIETMDLVNEKGNWYVVMEYAPFDLFAIVMTGKMDRAEIACSTLQILSGVTYLHSMGLAHRDLKLDNVVVNEHGIMKIIDFGSAAVFRYPFENDIVLASGIVGSDPYLAPEVYDLSKYDPQPTDIWSLAIIFCCMTLKRFPWKQPRVSDNSYKLFVSPPTSGPRTDIDTRSNGGQSEPTSRANSEHHKHQNRSENTSAPSTRDDKQVASDGAATNSTSSNGNSQPPTITGPWRLLRLLPRESRYIIGKMLEIDPKKRATMEEVLSDKWITGNAVCRQEDGGQIIRASGHSHTLQPGDNDAAAKKAA
ncbi:Pkinase-domain-containing protein [Pseudovirgaria hyperparasitica]|uniref:non-specific serine/threonine protein kinase n=1 Tax=Pseudovirgaria hyperparasitica TaxID=470096 RepID=A0A6A6VVG6_9PEZI|nr:Pkinase-domain-containing protein [Pseudovirgaria hyperparasitica]KAF2754562.1 Pkinase-domain-containing protein [Pseudovirgaria hyperparasitica]